MRYSFVHLPPDDKRCFNRNRVFLFCNTNFSRRRGIYLKSEENIVISLKTLNIRFIMSSSMVMGGNEKRVKGREERKRGRWNGMGEGRERRRKRKEKVERA